MTWISAQRGGHGAVREMIELVLRAQGRWDELLSVDHGAEPRMSLYAPLLVGLVALLAGLAIGKAWERYKLRDGQWIDRRRARESPHFIVGLEPRGRESDRSGDRRADQRAAWLDEDALEIHSCSATCIARRARSAAQ